MASKIIGINASARKDKATHFMLENCLNEAEKTATAAGSSVEVELIDLADFTFGGCIACGKCAKALECSQDDDFQQLMPKFSDPDLKGIIFATPVYMGSMTAQAKAFIDRSVMFRRNGFMFRDKVGAVLAVGGMRSGGQELTIQSIHAAMMIHDMIVVGNSAHFGGVSWSNHPDGYESDKIGVDTSRATGKRFMDVIVKMG